MSCNAPQVLPTLPYDGPTEPPVPFSHFASQGGVPAKCAPCPHLFEGECTRYGEAVGGYLHLDHGPCGVPGPTDPVAYEDEFVVAKVEVPRKCARCHYLAVDKIHGFHCTKDPEKWGDFHRGLDWGTRRPDFVYLHLPLPKITTRQLSQHAFDNDLAGFVREHRRVNPGLSVQEAREDFRRFRAIVEQ